MRPTARTIGKCPSALSFHATSTTSSPPCVWRDNSAHRSFRAAAAQASRASVATSPCHGFLQVRQRSVRHRPLPRGLGTAEPGCVLDDLRDAASEHGLMFGPDPATHKHCTIGGMLGNNSCGVHSLLSAKHGLGLRTSDNTHELEVLTYDGARFRVGETSPDELERIIRGGGRRGEIYAKMKAFARPLCGRHPQSLSEAAAASFRL